MKFSEEEKDMWLEDWKQSGKSAWTYAKANGLNPQTFVKWTRTEAGVKPCFVGFPVPVMPSAQSEPRSRRSDSHRFFNVNFLFNSYCA